MNNWTNDFADGAVIFMVEEGSMRFVVYAQKPGEDPVHIGTIVVRLPREELPNILPTLPPLREGETPS